MGKRMIRAWLERPLLSMARITKRHNAVAELVSQPMARQELSESMSGIHNLERLINKNIVRHCRCKGFACACARGIAVPAGAQRKSLGALVLSDAGVCRKYGYAFRYL